MKIYETQSLISGQEITKIRTKLFKNAKKIKNEIITNFPEVITDIFGADEAGLTEEVVPLSLTVGTDGTTREVEDSSGETQKIILAAASAVGIINKNNIEFKNDVLVDPVVVRTDGKHDLLIMKCLEYKTFNQLCKKLDKETLFIFDGSFWNILEDLRYLIENPSFHHFFTENEVQDFVRNLSSHITCHVVKEFYSYDIEKLLDIFDSSLNDLNHKRVADALLDSGEMIVESLHPNNMLEKYSYLKTSHSHEESKYIQAFNSLRKVSEEQYSGQILKFQTNQSSLKIEYLDNQLFQKNKKNVLKSLEIEMKGIQKEPYATFFAERTAKNVARATHSNYLMEKKIGMNSEDYMPNIPFKVRT